jgi:hypothetical protein
MLGSGDADAEHYPQAALPDMFLDPAVAVHVSSWLAQDKHEQVRFVKAQMCTPPAHTSTVAPSLDPQYIDVLAAVRTNAAHSMECITAKLTIVHPC